MHVQDACFGAGCSYNYASSGTIGSHWSWSGTRTFFLTTILRAGLKVWNHSQSLRSIIYCSSSKDSFIYAHVLSHFSSVQLFETLWTPLSMEFLGKNTEVGCRDLLQGNRSTPGIEHTSLMSPALQVDSLPLCHLGSPRIICISLNH